MTEQTPEPTEAEPGQVGDVEHGVPGDPEPMPEDDATRDEEPGDEDGIDIADDQPAETEQVAEVAVVDPEAE